MLPTNEIDTLTMTVTDAIDLPREGQIADGYACLVWGLHRAEEIAEETVEWGPGLVTRWQQPCDSYSHRYGVPLGRPRFAFNVSDIIGQAEGVRAPPHWTPVSGSLAFAGKMAEGCSSQDSLS
jgi:hypothetical protein